jgi:hypothetical protein
VSEELRVEFKVAFSGRRSEPKPVPEPGAKIERQRQDRATRRARNLALAYWIDGLVRSGEVEDLATVGKMCGVSRARVSKVASLLGMPCADKERLLGASCTDCRQLIWRGNC